MKARKQVKSEVGSFLSAQLSTAILQLKWKCLWENRFIIVGTVPAACCELRNGQLQSKGFDTEAEACAAIEAAGVKQYQRADCSWVGL